jgi:twinkle protein
MNAHELKLKLNERSEAVALMLLPGGRKVGHYIHAGSVAGEKGDSLRVCIEGAKNGVWLEGNGSDAGDLMDLWMAARNLSKREMFRQVHEYLGVPQEQYERKSRKEYKAPSVDGHDALGIISPVRKYLTEERRIPKDILKTFGIQQKGRDIVFPYHEEDGTLAMVKYIGVDRPEGKKRVFCSAGTKPILFGMNTPLVQDSLELTIAEGEIDAMSWQAAGVAAVSVPFGAKKETKKGSSPNDEWIENCYEWLEQFNTICIAMDPDEEGEAAAAAIIKRLGHERCKKVCLPKGKDANDVLKEDGTEELVHLRKTARNVDPENLRLASEKNDEVWDILQRGPRHEIGIPMFGWKYEGQNGWKFLLRPREGTFVTGFAGHGKSNLIYGILAHLAVVHNKMVYIGSYEEPTETILSIMATWVLGRQFTDKERPLFDYICSKLNSNIILHDVEGLTTVEEFVNGAKYAVKKYGVEFALLDSITCTDVNLDDNETVKAGVSKIQRLWLDTGLHCFTIVHPRKGMDESKVPLKPDIRGSAVIGDLAFNVLTVHRHDEEKAGYNNAYLKVSKQKVGGKQPEKHCWYHEGSCRIQEHQDQIPLPWIDIPQHLVDPNAPKPEEMAGDDDIPF